MSWTLNKGLKNNNFIKCFKNIEQIVCENANVYQIKYGFIPTFKSGFHFGEIVVGELGDIKKEIVFLGDTVNTTARIQEKCKELHKTVLFSKELIELINPGEYKLNYIGDFQLRGKEKKIGLYSF